MSVKKKDIEHLARLAKLHVSDEEVTEFQKDLSSILEYVSEIQSVDTADLEPMARVDDATCMRSDEPRDRENPHDLIEHAPKSGQHFVLAPSVRKKVK